MSAPTIAPETTPGFTTTVPEWAIEAYRTKIERANRKATRAGLGSPFALAVLAWHEVEREVSGLTITERFADIRVSGAPASIEGWRFAAAVDWTLSEPVLNVSPFYSGPTLPRPTDKVCDHCGVVRSRNSTYLVVGPDGTVKQVGRSCLQAYTGIHAGYVVIERDIAEQDDDYSSASADAFTYSVASVLTLAVALTDSLGYVSQGKADDLGQTSTRDRFLIAVHGARTQRDREVAESTNAALATRSRSAEDIAAEVEAITAWASRQSGSDYLLNLKSILAEAYIGRRHLGYALSAVGAFRRDRRHAARRAAEAAQRSPLTEGRYAVEGRIESVELREGYYGASLKARITLTEGGSVIWGNLPRQISGAVPGDVVAFTATITASDRDNTFGFFSRPVQARIVSRGSAA